MEKNRVKCFLRIVPFFAWVFFSAHLAGAHDLWLNVDTHYPEAGGKTTAKVVFGHNFPYYDILIARDSLADFSYLCPDGQIRKVENTREDKKGEKSGALAGDILCNQKGTYVVTASRRVKGDREHVPSEKYGKAVLVAEKGNDVVSRPFGHRIEIIPLKNPSEVKPGETMPVQVLFEGKPLSTYVYATYAGYYSEEEPFPVSVKSNEEGVAQIRISRPGTWMVVSNHKVDFSASLTFAIQ